MIYTLHNQFLNIIYITIINILEIENKTNVVCVLIDLYFRALKIQFEKLSR